MAEFKVQDRYFTGKAIIVEAGTIKQAKKKVCKEWRIDEKSGEYGIDRLTAEKITSISIVGKEVAFLFNPTNCFKERSGQCSLKASEEFLKQFEDQAHREKANSYYCVNLAQLVRERDPYKFPVNLIHNRCGHYDNGSGQHRVCIAGQLQLSVPIWLSKSKRLCKFCENPRNNVIKKF